MAAPHGARIIRTMLPYPGMGRFALQAGITADQSSSQANEPGPRSIWRSDQKSVDRRSPSWCVRCRLARRAEVPAADAD